MAGFDFNAAMAGAGTGSSFGLMGAVGGGLLGGFFGGGDEPEEYGADAYAKDMAPYKAMIDKQVGMSENLMNPDSVMNRKGAGRIMDNSMDQMGLANLMGGRQNAQAGGNSGLLQAAMNQNVSKYANQGLQQQNAYNANQFQQGTSMYGNAMQHQGDYSTGLANLNAANVGAANEQAASQQSMGLGGMGQLAGTVAGFGGKDSSLMDSATSWLGYGKKKDGAG